MTNQRTGTITSLPRDEVRWIQGRLAIAQYYTGPIDGIAGSKTREALARFKAEFYLEYPEMVGIFTLESLASLGQPDETTEQPPAPAQSPNPDAGQKRGRKASLAIVGEIFEHQWIVEDGYITWGELTKGLTRLPVPTAAHGSAETLVRNAITLAKAIRLVRRKFGHPIQVTSGYRPPAVNRAIGGARASQHLNFLAADIAPLDPSKWDVLLACIKATREITGIGIAGPRKGFWHVDCRVGDRVIFPYR